MSSDLCRAMGLPFNCVDDILDGFKRRQFVEVKSSLGYGPISELLSLTERGRHLARDYLETDQYVGPAPVPIAQYCAAVDAQRMPARWLTPERLTEAYSRLVISEAMLDQIAPAVASGKSLLIYGQLGNGKTQLAEALANIQSSDIYIPYSLECHTASNSCRCSCRSEHLWARHLHRIQEVVQPKRLSVKITRNNASVTGERSTRFPNPVYVMQQQTKFHRSDRALRWEKFSLVEGGPRIGRTSRDRGAPSAT